MLTFFIFALLVVLFLVVINANSLATTWENRKRYWAYLKYVLRHKWFVLLEGRKLKLSIWQLIVHDLSKFRRSEFVAYALTFYSIDGEKKYSPSTAFDIAWLHHQNRNPHHWNYWVLNKDGGETVCLDMPAKYWCEMVTDWRAMSRAFGSSVQEWYLDNHDKIQLNENTRQWVEMELFGPVFINAGNNVEGIASPITWGVDMSDFKPEMKGISLFEESRSEMIHE